MFTLLKKTTKKTRKNVNIYSPRSRSVRQFTSSTDTYFTIDITLLMLSHHIFFEYINPLPADHDRGRF